MRSWAKQVEELGDVREWMRVNFLPAGFVMYEELYLEA